MKRLIATGRTVEDAVTSALVKLGVSRSQATVRVITEPVKGIFGFIGGRDAQVEVTVKNTPEEAGREFLRSTLKEMGIEAVIRSQPEQEDRAATLLEISCDPEFLPVIIGRHGSTLESLQYLVNIVANRDTEKYVKFFVDAGEYRRKRREDLYRIADRAAYRALRIKKPVSLESMSSADRKIVHTYLQERSDVTTTSEGVDPNRKVVVVPIVQSGPAPSRR
jgi:spoIIIJ-associated protein